MTTQSFSGGPKLTCLCMGWTFIEDLDDEYCTSKRCQLVQLQFQKSLDVVDHPIKTEDCGSFNTQPFSLSIASRSSCLHGLLMFLHIAACHDNGAILSCDQCIPLCKKSFPTESVTNGSQKGMQHPTSCIRWQMVRSLPAPDFTKPSTVAKPIPVEAPVITAT